MKLMSFAGLLLLVAAMAAGCAPSDTPPAEAPASASIPFRNDGTLRFTRGEEELLTIAIEIADTDSAIVRGLMQRTSLPDLAGMLFLMPSEEPQSFWMANTPLALDLFFANTTGEIVSIARYTRPLSPEPVLSNLPARFVLETPAGFADSHGIIEGDRIAWERTE
jgi:uncharacterized protein